MQGKLSRGFETVNLTFSFPFYGHKISSVTISAKGFISTSPAPFDEDLIAIGKKSRKPVAVQVRQNDVPQWYSSNEMFEVETFIL